MKTISRYIGEEFIKYLLLTFVGLLITFFAIDVLERIDAVLQKGGAFEAFMKYLLYKIPIVSTEVLPFSVLVASTVSIGILSKTREILALQTSGAGDHILALPILSIALGVSLLVVVGNEASSALRQKTESIWAQQIKGGRPSEMDLQAGKLWYKKESEVYSIDFAQPEVLEGLRIFRMEGNKLKTFLEAESAKWEKDHWVLYRVTLWDLTDGSIKREQKEQMLYPLAFKPKDIRRSLKEPHLMSFEELRRYIKRAREAGHRPYAHAVELHCRLSYGFSCLALAMLGVPIALWTGRKREGGVPQGIAVGLLVGTIYYTFFSLTQALGRAGYLPPFFAAWAANISFMALGVYLPMLTKA